jgi:L-threonylcarbamoyladenylate synthase
MKPLFWGNRETIIQIADLLKSGKVVLAAGDTVLGLLADISQNGFAQLDAIKKRSNQPYLLLVENKQKALNLIEKTFIEKCQIEKIMDICWPGPATLILKAKPEVPEGVKSPDGTIAIRVPDHKGLLQLLHHFDALYSTSANLKGQPVPANLEEIDPTIVQSVASIVLNDNDAASTLASTIIDCTGETLKIIRQGAFAPEKLGL